MAPNPEICVTNTNIAKTAIFTAECAPPKVRGALTMQWQMWTAFGIMMGYVADLALYQVSCPVQGHNHHTRDPIRN